MEEEKARTENSNNNEGSQKISYDDLMNIASQLRQQNIELRNRINQTETIEKRLYFLFEVIKNGDIFGDFTKKCVDEVVSILTIPEETDAKEENGEVK